MRTVRPTNFFFYGRLAAKFLTWPIEPGSDKERQPLIGPPPSSANPRDKGGTFHPRNVAVLGAVPHLEDDDDDDDDVHCPTIRTRSLLDLKLPGY
jgi:hypothetical protein